MRAVVNWLFLIALSLWVGSIAFVTLLLAPALKSQFPADQFFQIVKMLFPNYFQLGVAVGFIVFLISFVRTFRAEHPKRLLKWGNLLIMIMLALTVIGGYVLVPQMQELGTNGEQLVQLYNYTQGVNLLNLLCGLLVLLILSIDMRILPGRLSRGSGYSMRF